MALPVSLALFGICLPAYAQDSNAAEPAAAEQQRIVEAMRKYAEDYVSNLPNFVCQQVTMQFEGSKNGKHWHKDDTLTSKLVYNHGREERTLQLVNNKPVRPNARPRSGTSLSTEGEFGLLLSRVFEPNSEAKFTWVGWETIRGQRVAKFGYSIDRAHSTLVLTNYIKATVPYHGSIFGDPANGAIWRATSGTTEIPESLQMRSIETTVEYDQVKIGDKNYLLPVSAQVLLITDKDQVRHELHFGDYRKFEAESTITFGGGEESPPTTPQDPKH